MMMNEANLPCVGYYGGMPNPRSNRALWGMQNRMWQQEADAKLVIAKKAELSAISIQESEAKAKVRSDVASRRELQCTNISIGKDGYLILNKEQFGADVKGKLPIKIVQARKVRMMGDSCGEEVLIIQLEKADGQLCDLLFRSTQLDNRFIMRQFDKAGISFGFGSRKELEVKKEIILSQLDKAVLEEIPVRHGWYQQGDLWRYAFPQERTWKEVQAWM